MFNPIFKENVQGWKHPWRLAFTEPEKLSYKEPKHVAPNNKNGHKNPNNSHSYHDGIELYQGIIKKKHIMTLNTKNNANPNPKISPIDCDGVQLTKPQCHMVSISILSHRYYWTIQLKYSFETQRERTVSYNLTHHHGHTNSWYVS